MIKKIFATAFVFSLVSLPVLAEDDYTKCMQTASAQGDDALAVCMNDNTSQLLQEIRVEYETAAKDERLSKWSDGVGMRSGKLRNTYEDWLAFRDKYCEVFMVSMQEYMRSDAFNKADCLMSQTKRHLTDIKRLNINANSVVY